MANEYVPYEGPIVTLADARRDGALAYFTGKPCPHGHLSLRSTADSKCRECRRATEQKRRDTSSDVLNAARRAARAANPAHYRDSERAYRLANPDRIREKARIQRKRHSEKIRARDKRWREENSEYLRLNKKEYYESNKPHFLRVTKIWRDANAEKCKGYGRARRARLKNAEGHHSPEDIDRIYKLQRGKCAACKTALKQSYQVDHIRALSKGGNNTAANLQLLCTPCNRSKSDKDPIVWAQDCGWLL